MVDAFSTLSPKQHDLLSALASAHVEHVVIGGYAMRFHGRKRRAKDLDLLVGFEPANAERLFAVLSRVGKIDPVVGKAKLKEPLKQIRWHDVELLTSIDGLPFTDVLRNAVRVSVGELSLLVASVAHLLQSKRVAGRPEDREDVEYLEGIANAV